MIGPGIVGNSALGLTGAISNVFPRLLELENNGKGSYTSRAVSSGVPPRLLLEVSWE